MVKPPMRSGKYWLILLVIAVFFAIQCKSEVKKPKEKDPLPVENVVVRPAFDAQKAYDFIQKQVDFGPRVPGTAAHKACADWLAAQLDSFGAKVTVQTGQVTRYDNVKMPMYNIVGSFNPEAKKRLLLCAHWDTRHVADQDDENKNSPIEGANDGGSGVGILLEIARQLQIKNPTAGVDIIFFDVEDQGQPDGILPMKKDTYCLGSQYWAKTPHIPGYTAQNGILLDMVGAKDAIFTLEGTSMYFAPEWMRKVWDKAIQLGHSKYFNYSRTDPITDDHLYINQIKGIPTIDIIQNDRNTRSGFGAYWHTHDDNMSVIDKATLQAVGETVLAITYEY
jgi:hypothetical protein